jgi:NAD(P)-dependent dehydrogenase (short-subunit alcohol dehydrogenase family)
MFLPDLLKGKAILVTGGGTGLGKAMGQRFLELGAHLVICGRREQVLKDTTAEFDQQFKGRTSWHVCDVRNPESVEAMVEAQWKRAPLDALLNNAAGNIAARSETLSTRAIDAVLGIVLHGTAYCTWACGKRWLDEKRKASVLSILATYAWTGCGYVVPSAMAKAGVMAMTQSLAVEWGGRGIRMNAIAPGPFPTEGAWSRLVPRPDLAKEIETSNPLGRPGRHEELGNLASYLLSDQAEYINGECVTIDAGRWLKGAGQLNFLERLSEQEWAMMRPAKRN